MSAGLGPLATVTMPAGAVDHETWTGLALRAGNVFATPEWHAAWEAHLLAGRPITLGMRDAAGALRGLVPLVLTRERGVRVLRLRGHGPADELGPICAPADRPAVLAALRGWLREQRGWDTFVAEVLPDAGRPWDLALGGRTSGREASPILQLPEGGWDAYLAGCSRNLREQLRRRERKLRREHDVAITLTTDPAALEADLETLVALHHLRFAEGESRAFAGAWRTFHHDFARRALAREILRLWILRVDGEPAAAWYGLRFGRADVFYQSGRDPRWDRQAVGFVLLAHSIRDATEAAQAEYRFGRGDEGYKDRFATHDPGLVDVTATRGPVGRSQQAWTAVRPHLRRLARPVR